MKRIFTWIPALVVLGVLTVFSPDCYAQKKASDATPAAKSTAIAKVQSADESEKLLSERQRFWIGETLFYIPNRLLDLSDILTLNLKTGAVFEFNLRGTRALGLGAGWGPSYVICKDFNRQVGTALQHGWYRQFLFLQAENMERLDTTWRVRDYWQFGSNFPTLYQGIYQSNIRDYWELGLSVSFLFGIDMAIHPLEMVDFLCGIFLLDNLLPQPPFIHDSIRLDLMMF